MEGWIISSFRSLQKEKKKPAVNILEQILLWTHMYTHFSCVESRLWSCQVLGQGAFSLSGNCGAVNCSMGQPGQPRARGLVVTCWPAGVSGGAYVMVRASSGALVALRRRFRWKSSASTWVLWGWEQQASLCFLNTCSGPSSVLEFSYWSSLVSSHSPVRGNSCYPLCSCGN